MVSCDGARWKRPIACHFIYGSTWASFSNSIFERPRSRWQTSLYSFYLFFSGRKCSNKKYIRKQNAAWLQFQYICTAILRVAVTSESSFRTFSFSAARYASRNSNLESRRCCCFSIFVSGTTALIVEERYQRCVPSDDAHAWFATRDANSWCYINILNTPKTISPPNWQYPVFELRWLAPSSWATAGKTDFFDIMGTLSVLVRRSMREEMFSEIPTER